MLTEKSDSKLYSLTSSICCGGRYSQIGAKPNIHSDAQITVAGMTRPTVAACSLPQRLPGAARAQRFVALRQVAQALIGFAQLGDDMLEVAVAAGQIQLH